jgi:hypothetical protein
MAKKSALDTIGPKSKTRLDFQFENHSQLSNKIVDKDHRSSGFENVPTVTMNFYDDNNNE